MDINAQLGLTASHSSFDGAEGVVGDVKELGTDIIDTAKDVGAEALDKAQELYDLAKPEAEALVRGVKQSKTRLDAEPRIFPFMPNSLLMLGLVGGLVWVLNKK